MKRNIFFVSVTAVGCWLSSCVADYTYEVTVPVSDITLVAPQAEAELDLNDRSADTYVFSWNRTDRTGYTLALSGSQFLLDPVCLEAGNAGSYSVAAERLDRIASDFGVVSGKKGTLYWAVKPTDRPGIAAFEIRPLTVRRLISRLLSPVNSASVALDSDRSGLSVNFTWDAEGEDAGAEYAIVFSDNSELTGETVSFSVGAVRSAGLTHEQLQDVFARYARHPFESLRLYWNIRKEETGEYLSRTASSIVVDPMMIFKDVRGDEEITYRVAKITYTDGRVQYWLAENLRTRKYRDGTDIEAANIMFAPESAFTEAQIRTFGGYYRPGPAMFEKLPPAGWRIPTIDEFRDLYAEALAREGSYNVLRDPEFYSYEPAQADPLTGKWKLGLVTGGQQQGEDKAVTNTTYCYLMATGIGDDVHRAAMLDHFAIWEVWSVGSNVRFIYTN